MSGKIKLTKFSHGAGCGCKIAPKVLDEILSNDDSISDDKLLVGNDTKDDAAVYDIGDGRALISTTDFFMPIVDDAFDFGRIASVNSLSDVYAMGGKPLVAIAVFGWPVNKIDISEGKKVLSGARKICSDAGISLAGGHSIDSPEPIFGLAVTGMADIDDLKRNNTAVPGLRLYLTKPLGVGILTTAQKRELVSENDFKYALDSMLKLNDLGYKLRKCKAVRAMTDVTGFSLLGHLSEMCSGSGVSAVVDYDKVPIFPVLGKYIKEKCFPGAIARNWEAYGDETMGVKEEYKPVLCDPQTSGGLLIAVHPEGEDEFLELARKDGFELSSFGETSKKDNKLLSFK